MKVFVLNPSFGDDFCRSARWAAKSRGRVQRHPDWILTAVAVLERDGHDVHFLDAATRNLSKQRSLAEIDRFKPDLFVTHTTTPSIYSDLAYAHTVREKHDIPTVAVGPHVTAVPDNTFEIAGRGLDVIARGEYEYPLLDVANGVPYTRIDGISFREAGQVHHNPDRAPCDVNTLPFPAWHHIQPEWYHDGGKLYPFLTLISGRGCFGRCTFCRDTSSMYGRKVRMRDPKLVVDEMEYDLRLFPQLREIMFETDSFTAIPRITREISQEIIARGIDIPWSCNTRVDMKLDLLPLMKRAGCRMLMVGYEFGTQAALDSVRKGTTVKQSIQFSKRAAELDFVIHGCFMVGAPGETEDMVKRTFQLANALPLDTIQVSGICTYPGTDLYDWAEEQGYLVPQDWREWIDTNREQVTLLNYPQLSKDRIDALIDEGLKGFYLRPCQVLRMVKNIRSWGDIRRKLFGLKSFVDYFVLSRKIKS